MIRLYGVLMTSLLLAACGPSCEDDVGPASIIETSDNPYRIFRRSTDLDITSARWENHTANQSGSALVYQDYACVWPLWCGTWTHMDASIPLSPGLNRVTFYETSDGCEWRDENEITLM